MYLLDTTAVSDVLNTSSARHLATKQFIEEKQGYESSIHISWITLGEMRFGQELFAMKSPPPSPADLQQIEERLKCVAMFGEPLAITRHVVNDYAKLRAAYAKGVAPNLISNGKLKSRPPERWAGEALSAGQLQITENDIWIAAIAVTYDLTLVTADRDYLRIKEYFSALNLKKIDQATGA